MDIWKDMCRCEYCHQTANCKEAIFFPQIPVFLDKMVTLQYSRFLLHLCCIPSCQYLPIILVVSGFPLLCISYIFYYLCCSQYSIFITELGNCCMVLWLVFASLQWTKDSRCSYLHFCGISFLKQLTIFVACRQPAIGKWWFVIHSVTVIQSASV